MTLTDNPELMPRYVLTIMEELRELQVKLLNVLEGGKPGTDLSDSGARIHFMLCMVANLPTATDEAPAQSGSATPPQPSQSAPAPQATQSPISGEDPIPNQPDPGDD